MKNSMDELNARKKLIRERMHKQRNSLSFEEVREKSKKIKDTLFSLSYIKESNKIMTYVSFKNEVSTIDIINELLKMGKEIIVPICDTKDYTLIPSRILSMDELSVSYFGIMEPKEPFIRPVDPKDIDVILVPGLAFDRNRNRLGHGKGFYDRFLRGVKDDAIKIALAYDFQILDSIPAEDWDIPMDLIITNKGIV